MLYLYDKALAQDLKDSINPQNVDNSAIKVVEPEQVVDLVSQINNDNVSFPVLALTRGSDYQVDTSRMNFTFRTKGSPAVFDPDTHEIYNEECIPIDLEYAVTILTTNLVDQDELIREIMFKYSSQGFLTIELPYESNRKIRVGICVDFDQPIESSSRSRDYVASGLIYQAIIHLKLYGAVLLNYVSRKLPRYDVSDIGIENNSRTYRD